MQTKAKNGKDTGSKKKNNTPQGNIDMREVLKGLGTVKLKTVPRHGILLKIFYIGSNNIWKMHFVEIL